MKRALAYFAIWTASALVIALLLGSLDLRGFYALATDGVRAQGTVLAMEPLNHRLVTYAYRAGASTYTGSGTLGEGNPCFEALDLGDAVFVYYARADPASSTLGDPHARLRNEIESISIPAVLFPSMIVLGLVRRRRRSRAGR